MFSFFQSDGNLPGWLGLGLLASGRGLRHVWEMQVQWMAAVRETIAQANRRLEADLSAAPRENSERSDRGSGAPAVYTAHTHYCLRKLQPGMRVVNGVSVMVYHATLEWRLDRDGRDRRLEELNLSHLRAQVIQASSELPQGAIRSASVTLMGVPAIERFFPKD